MHIHVTGGFLGSGKTTAIRQACAILQQEGTTAGVITNDQGDQLVDGFYFDSLQIPARQVVNGCFCCNYPDLENQILSLQTQDHLSVAFAESVGSCTDLVATVLKPLLRFRAEDHITLSVFADAVLLADVVAGKGLPFGEDVRYIYFKQLEEAGMIVVSKTDLIGESAMASLKLAMPERFPDKRILYVNVFQEDGVRAWLQALEDAPPVSDLRSLEIDYDRYGAGEANLAWLDREIEVYSHTNNAIREAIDIAEGILYAIREKNYAIGHLKFLLDGKIKISYTSGMQTAIATGTSPARAFSASLLINARVETLPQNLEMLVAEVCRKAQLQSGCSVVVKNSSAFQPGYPTPTHRW